MIFNRLNANIELCTRAATPTATAVVCTSNPVHRPAVTNNPAARPCSADWVRTNRLSGPGTSPSMTDAMKNTRMTWPSSMGELYPSGAADRDWGQAGNEHGVRGEPLLSHRSPLPVGGLG